MSRLSGCTVDKYYLSGNHTGASEPKIKERVRPSTCSLKAPIGVGSNYEMLKPGCVAEKKDGSSGNANDIDRVNSRPIDRPSNRPTEPAPPLKNTLIKTETKDQTTVTAIFERK